MNTLPESLRFAAGDDHNDAALLRAVADMRPGWVVLRDCVLADDGRGTRTRVRYALLHPKIGIALLDVPPGATTPRAPDRMRHLLDATGFRRAFGDYPPIVYLCVPSRALSDVASPLAREFGSLPPLVLAGGEAWVAAAQRALAAIEEPSRLSGRMTDGGRSEPIGSPGPERAEGWSVPRLARGLRGLGVFWGAVTMTLGGGALVLQYLGPPEPPAAIAHAGTGPEGAREGARATSGEAWLTPALPGAAARPSAPGPMLALWPAERMRTRFDAAHAGGAAALESGDAAAVDARLDEDRPAPIDIVTAVRSQVADALMEPAPASVPEIERSGGSDNGLPTGATRPPPPSEPGSGAPGTASGSEDAPAGGGAPPAAVGTTAGSGTAQAPGATADDETPASVSGSGADAAAAEARDAGPVAPLLPGLGGAAAPAQASVPTAPPAGAPDVPAAADMHDPPHADPQSARGPDGIGGADGRPPPATEPEAAPGAFAPSETAHAPGTSPAQEGGRASVPQTADAHSAEPAAASAAETASPSATATADAPPAAVPPALTRAEPLPAPVQPAETAGPSTAAAASVAESAAKPQPPPPSGASPAAVAALLARGDALIAIGNVAAARLVYQRAAAHASARAATAMGKTYDPRFLQAIGAIGVVADPDAAAAWYRRGSTLGDEDATPLLGGLEVKASR